MNCDIEVNTKEALSKIITNNGGVDPITQARRRMKNMSREDLENLVLIASNHVGVQMNNGEDYKDDVEALNFVVLGIKEVFSAYDTALLSTLTTQTTN